MSLRISIITPSYNQGQFLEKTILSIINQNYTNIEFIVVDGGSTDNSLEIIKKYENQISLWSSEKDKGQSDAINKGFRQATGDIFGWINSDDLLMPHALERVENFFVHNSDIQCVMGDLDIIDAQEKILFQKKAISFNFYSALFSVSLVPQPATFFTRDAWERAGDLDIEQHYLMDYEYFLRMARCGINFGVLKQTLAAFRIHGKSKTFTQYDHLFFEMQKNIQLKYAPPALKILIRNTIFIKLLKQIYRGRNYAVRFISRGDGYPLKTIKIRKSI